MQSLDAPAWLWRAQNQRYVGNMIERLTMTLNAMPGRTCSVGEMFKLFCKIFELTSLKEVMAAAEA